MGRHIAAVAAAVEEDCMAAGRRIEVVVDIAVEEAAGRRVEVAVDIAVEEEGLRYIIVSRLLPCVIASNCTLCTYYCCCGFWYC